LKLSRKGHTSIRIAFILRSGENKRETLKKLIILIMSREMPPGRAVI
jgi:hypothetical protein